MHLIFESKIHRMTEGYDRIPQRILVDGIDQLKEAFGGIKVKATQFYVIRTFIVRIPSQLSPKSYPLLLAS